MNLRRSLAIFDSIGCEILLVRVPAEEAEVFFRDPLGAITTSEVPELKGPFNLYPIAN